MKYEVKVKQVVVNEMTISVEADSAVAAMEERRLCAPVI